VSDYQEKIARGGKKEETNPAEKRFGVGGTCSRKKYERGRKGFYWRWGSLGAKRENGGLVKFGGKTLVDSRRASNCQAAYGQLKNLKDSVSERKPKKKEEGRK